MSIILLFLFISSSLCASDIPSEEPISLVVRLTHPVTMRELEEQVPLPQLVLAREAIKGRVHYIAQHQDLTPFATEELVVANKFLQIQKIDEYDQWFDENGCYIVGGLTAIAFAPLAIGVSSAMVVSHYISGAIGFLGTTGTVKTAALSCLPVSAVSGVLFSNYYQPDQTVVEDAIERTDREIEKRKIQNIPDE